jgi:membrane associated rhomboid family serine protease
MTPTPVGMRCPECMRERTRVTHGAAAFGSSLRAPATFVLIAINVAVYLAEIASGPGGLGTPGATLINNYSLIGTSVAGGEWYRLLTGAFLHEGLTHIGFNMVALYFLGRLLEPAIGTTRFVFVYFASLFAGSLGALLLSGPDALTLGASGAIFGIFGAAFVIARGRGFDSVARTIGVILLFNLAISLGDPHISLGGHLGGLVAGVLCAFAIVAGERGRLGQRHLPAELAVMTVVGVISIAASIAIA